MAVSVRSALNRANVIGFDVTTSDHTLTSVVSRNTITSSGFNYIYKIRAELTGGHAEFFPLGHPQNPADLPANKEDFTDLMASNANAAQAAIVVTNINRFAVGDYIFIQDNTYTNYEWKRVITVTTATDTLTCDSVLANSYTVANGGEVGILGNKNSRMPITVGFLVNEAGLNFQSLYVRKLQAANVRVKGYVVVV